MAQRIVIIESNNPIVMSPMYVNYNDNILMLI
jgi:hypothetical protein